MPLSLKAGLMALAFLFLALWGGAQTARADPITLVQGGSNTLTYQSPNFMGSSATALFSLNGNVLTVTLTNTSTNGTFVSGLGFDTTPDVMLSTGTTSLSGWTATSGAGGGLGTFELIAYGNGNPDRLAAGDMVTATFTLTSAPATLNLDQAVAHLTSLPNGESEKLSPMPEPATMLLFGMGLAGVAAMARRRRKTPKTN